MLKYKQLKAKGSKGITLESFEKREHNVWLGISLSNKFFTKETIQLLIEFAVEYTKDKVLVWIPGRMQAINYRYFDGLSRAESLRKAFEDEERIINDVKDILGRFPSEKASRIVIANYDDVCTPKHIRQREIFFREFSEQKEFYDALMEIVKGVIDLRGRTYDKTKAESLALYIIQELPLFVDGVQKNGDDTLYTVVPYPGFGKIDELEMDLVVGKRYPELTQKLSLSNKVGILNIELDREASSYPFEIL
jgi:tRNA-dependent cyclodipeptide synthase